MAYIHPNAGHNSNNTTTNNGDNQLITPPHYITTHQHYNPHRAHKPIQAAQGQQPPAKHHPSHLRTLAAVAVMLFITLETWGQTNQNVDWNTNNRRSRYYNMCGDRQQNQNNLSACNSCTTYYTISDDDNATDNAGWMTFKAPDGCTLTVTLTSNTNRLGRRNDNRDRIYVSESTTGSTQNQTNVAGHAEWSYDGAATNPFTSTTAGSYVTICFQNGANAGNNQYSRFTITVECNCSSSGCSNATSLPCGTTNLAGTTEGAPNIPHGIPGADASNRGAWYTFTGDGSETTITTTSASFDNCIVVASGSCNNLTLVAEIDDSYGDESYSFQTTNGDTYYVYIAYYESGNTTGTFNISRTCATAPSNSSCATATNLPCGTSNLEGTTVGTPGTAHGIPNADVSNYGVWYTFIGNGNATTITTSNSTFDEEIVIAKGSCNNLTFVGSIDGNTRGETYTFFAENGVTYYVYIAHYGAGYTTTGNFTISRTCTTPPSNSTCGNATNLPCGTSNLAGTTVGTPGTAHGTGYSISNYGVWYTFVGNGGETTISSTATFDHAMAILRGPCNNLSGIELVDNTSGSTESYTFQTTNGVTYYVYIAYYGSGDNTTGTFTISRTCVEALCPPSNMTNLSYSLEDSFGDGWNGASMRVVDVATGNTLATWTVDGYSSTGTLSVCCGREIRFVWTSGSYDGECSYSVSEGGSVIFSGSGAMSSAVTHTPCPSCPAPSNVNVSSITATSATVSWTENGSATRWIVEYGTSSDFTGATQITVNTNPTTNLTGLTAGTTYYVRVKADCGGGDHSEWSSTSFTTPCAEYCDIEYLLTDSYSDGWNGAAIQVVDVGSANILATWTIDDGSSASGALSVCKGREIRFQWISGSYDSECSYTISDSDGSDIVNNGSGSGFPKTFTPNCPTDESCDGGSWKINEINGTTQTIECGKSYCFYDSGGKTGNYSASESYTASFSSEGVISIQFVSMQGEEAYDEISISGTTTTVTNAYTIPGGTTYTASSPGGVVTVSWHSDGSYQYSGWKALITAEGCCTPREGVAGFEFCLSSLNLEPGATVALPVNGADGVTPGGTVTYNSSNTSVATVDADGTVTAVAAGTATITATIAAATVSGTDYCAATTSYTVTIGTICKRIGTGGGTADIAPIQTTYKHSWTQMIYDKEELSACCSTIEKIVFFHNGTNSYERDVKVYMAQPDGLSTFANNTSFLLENQLTPVWESSSSDVEGDTDGDGKWDLHDGENVLTLPTPFEYDCNKNLVVAVYSRASNWNTTYFQSSTTSGNKTIYAYGDGNDNSASDPWPSVNNSGLSGFSGTKSVGTDRPDIKLCFNCPPTPLPSVTLTGVPTDPVCAGTPISITVEAENGTVSFSPALPSGLTYNTTTHKIEGSISTAGTYEFTVVVTAADDCLKDTEDVTIESTKLEATIEFGD